MSDQKESRRSFIKGSVAKGLIATNAAALAGLINTPGSAGADTTQQPGTTTTTYLAKTKTMPANQSHLTAEYESAAEARKAAYDFMAGPETNADPTSSPTLPITPIYSGGAITERIDENGKKWFRCTVGGLQQMKRTDKKIDIGV